MGTLPTSVRFTTLKRVQTSADSSSRFPPCGNSVGCAFRRSLSSFSQSWRLTSPEKDTMKRHGAWLWLWQWQWMAVAVAVIEAVAETMAMAETMVWLWLWL